MCVCVGVWVCTLSPPLHAHTNTSTHTHTHPHTHTHTAAAHLVPVLLAEDVHSLAVGQVFRHHSCVIIMLKLFWNYFEIEWLVNVLLLLGLVFRQNSCVIIILIFTHRHTHTHTHTNTNTHTQCLSSDIIAARWSLIIYLYGKTDLSVWQKRPVCMKKEAYS